MTTNPSQVTALTNPKRQNYDRSDYRLRNEFDALLLVRVTGSASIQKQELMSAAKERSTAHIGLLRHRLK